MVFNKFTDLRPEHKEHVLCIDDKGTKHEADFLELDEAGTRYCFAAQYALDEEAKEVFIFESVDNVVAWAGIENILKGENENET